MLPRKWLAAELMTGKVIAYLPSLSSDQPFRRTLGQYETNEAVLNITAATDPEWPRALNPWASVLVAYRGLPGQEVIEWAGIVNQEVKTLGSQVRVPLITGEGYLDRCYVGDYTTDPTNTGATKDQNTIASDVVNQFAVANGGLPITVIIVGGAGTQRQRTYTDASDTTVYATLEELMSVDGGCEWTMHWQWLYTPNPQIVPVIYIGSRIGTPVTPGSTPACTFSADQLTDATHTLDWSSRSGANVVTATLGSGPGRPTAKAIAASFGGRPRLEYRFSPSVPITDQATLQLHANAQLALMQNGAETVSLIAPIKRGILFGTDWNIGDDIGYHLAGPAYPIDKVGVTRAIGYESTDSTITPTVLGS